MAQLKGSTFVLLNFLIIVYGGRVFTLDIRDAVARITIDRGQKRNAVPMAQWAQLERLVSEANRSTVQALVIASADPNSFCAGSDLSELTKLKDDARLRRCFRGSMESVFNKIRAVNKPTIALISGGCFGTGVSLAAACDIRVAHPSAIFAIPPARFGIAYPQADVDRLVTLVGAGQAAHLLFGCITIDAIEALRIGLVERIDAGDELGAELVEGISGNSAVSLRTLKAMLQGRAGTREGFDQAFASSDFSRRIHSRTADKAVSKSSVDVQ